jgi:phosphomannomutase
VEFVYQMTTAYIFDVDGTLTPSRQRMDRGFAVWFSEFCETHDVYLVSGSDRAKTIEQVGEYIYHSCKRVYNCSGNDVWQRDVNIRHNDWKLPDDVRQWLLAQLDASDFSIRTGNHIEERPGVVNFSIVGRNADLQQRAAYVDFEEWNGERSKIAAEFNLMFPTLYATVGGETGLDIAPLGADKSQILSDFDRKTSIMFYGDRTEPGGNDYPLRAAIEQRDYLGQVFQVTDWQHTWNLLKDK